MLKDNPIKNRKIGNSSKLDFLAHGGEMGKMIRAKDWSKTPLGPVESWPQSLRTVVRIMLASRQPIWIGWGSEFTMLYNDSYRSIVGDKHPDALGQPAKIVWKSIWSYIGPELKNVVKKNRGTYVESQLLITDRHGYPEEAYYTYSYDPISSEDGIGGILCTNTDETTRVIDERQLSLLRTLAADNLNARSIDEVCDISSKSLLSNQQDIPFSMIYLVDENKKVATLAGTCGIERNHKAVPEIVDLTDESPWSFVEVIKTCKSKLVTDLDKKYKKLPTGAWDIPPDKAVVVPILKQGKNSCFGILVVALNPYRKFDANYQGFIDLVVGQIASSLTIVDEYTGERQRAENMTKRESYYREMIDNTPTMTLIIDTKGGCIYLNKQWYRYTGQKPETALGVGWMEAVHADDIERIREVFIRSNKSQKSFSIEFRLKNIDGKYYWHLGSGRPYFDEKKIFQGFIGSVVDVHEQRTNQEAYRESERRFRTLADNIQNLTWVARADGWTSWYNQRWYDYTGTTPEQMHGWGWKEVHHPDYVDRILTFLQTAWSKPKSWELTFPLRAKDGTYRWFLTRAVPILNKDGNIDLWIGTSTDVEDLRRKHEMEQRMELLTEQRNALLKINKTKDEFIALASHQLRTPATAVKQYVGLILEGFSGKLTPDQLQLLQVAYDSNERQLNIINDLLKTAQIDNSKYELNIKSRDIVRLLKEVIDDTKSVLDLRKQTVKFDSPKKSIKIMIDRSEMKLALTNLLENASKYSHESTVIDAGIVLHDNYVDIIISDQGVGIGKEHQRRIFDKFTRVKNELHDDVAGTGLGLYWVKQIAEMHKGSIELVSAPGKGSTFTMRLPK